MRVAKGTELSFQRAVATHQAALRASALRLTRSRSDADDLLQDALLRALRFWHRYREQDNCRAWLQRVAGKRLGATEVPLARRPRTIRTCAARS